MASTGLVHAVFFTLKNRTPAAVESLIAACHKYLPDHQGVVHFAAGPRAAQYQRPVNDQEFDVALVVTFATAADHDQYQASPRHHEFIADQRENWAQVRVFDATT